VELNPSQPAAGVQVLAVQDFSKTYEDKPAVDRLSLSLAGGEILGLVGPNGAGKTTTLRSIAGILPVKSGNIRVAGHDITTEEAIAKSALYWIPDDPRPFDSLTVAEHLEFTAALYGVKDWRARAEGLLARFELVEKRDALGGELSRGMRQKLAFCCAWLSSPKLVLMDEPLTGLDPRGIRSAKDAIRELAAGGTAVILSSHLLELIEELATRILILAQGKKVFEGTLAQARKSIAADEAHRLEDIFMAITESHGDAARFAAGPNGEPPIGGARP
jgi:ABC-2 type transport system ATP-binding protein